MLASPGATSLRRLGSPLPRPGADQPSGLAVEGLRACGGGSEQLLESNLQERAEASNLICQINGGAGAGKALPHPAAGPGWQRRLQRVLLGLVPDGLDPPPPRLFPSPGAPPSSRLLQVLLGLTRFGNYPPSRPRIGPNRQIRFTEV